MTYTSAPNEPISKVEPWNGSHPWLVVKHKDICSVLTDERLSNERRRPGFPELNAGGKEAAKNKPSFVDMEPPQQMQQTNKGTRIIHFSLKVLG